MKVNLKTEYVKSVYVVFKDSDRSVDEFTFEDFITQVAIRMLNLEDIEFITQEGAVALRYIQNHNGVFKKHV